jgi:hypothetical protein
MAKTEHPFDKRDEARSFLQQQQIPLSVVSHILDQAMERGAFTSAAWKVTVTYERTRKGDKWRVVLREGE